MDNINLKFGKEEFNEYLGNIIEFNDDDIKMFHDSYQAIVENGFSISYLSCIFYSIYIGELVIGLLNDDKIRSFLLSSIEDEMTRNVEESTFRNPQTENGRFGLNPKEDEQSKMMLMDLISKSLNKIHFYNEWFGTEEGKKDKYDYSEEDIVNIKTILCRFPYLLRRHDYDESYADQIIGIGTEIMEHI